MSEKPASDSKERRTGAPSRERTGRDEPGDGARPTGRSGLFLAPQKPATAEQESASTAMMTAMRGRMRDARKAGVIAFLDIGSSKIACLLARIDSRQSGYGALTILGAGVHRSRGVRLGAVADMAEAERAIRAAVNQAERDAGERAFHVVATLTGAYPRSHGVSAEIAVSGSRISEKDMRKALAACKMPREGEGRSVLHAIAVNWSVDGESGLRDPSGFSGRRLGVDLHVLTVAESAARNLAHCLAGADLELAALVATPYASGLACLAEEELEDGAACIDLGGGVTSIGLFMKGDLVFADVVRIGGEQITTDIVRQLGLPRNEAERVKTLEGSAALMAGAAKDTLSFSPEQTGLFEGARPTRADLSAAIRPRIDETLELARDRLAQAGFFYLPSRRVVLTGGAAQLEGVIEAAQAVFGPQVRLGRPVRLSGLPAPFAGPAFSAVAGVAGYALKPADALWDKVVVNEKKKPGPWGGLVRWFRDTW